MLRSLFTLVRYFIFWLLFFAVTRATFELYFADKMHGVSVWEVIQTFLYGLRMDASATAYICIIPLLVFIVNLFVGKKPVKAIWLKIYTWFCLFFISLIAIVDLGIFTEWGAKVNFRAFTTLYNSPAESMSSTASSPIVLHLVIGVTLLVIGGLLYRAVVDRPFARPDAPTRTKVYFSVALLGINFLLLRGTLSPAPIDQSAGYFSDNQILDLAAQNTEWNLVNNIFENLRPPHNPYLYMAPDEAKRVVSEAYTVKKDSTVKLLTTDKPNIVIIQLESFSADLIESLGGQKGVAPNFEQLARTGVLFNNIYSAGDRTDKGIIAILSAYPSQAIRTIIIDTPKQAKLPSMVTSFKKAGYATSYFYGGEADYMHFDHYMDHHDIDLIFDKRYIDKKDVGSTWGAYDNILLGKHLAYGNKEKQPFFSLVQTSTNHEPFVLPTTPHFKGKELSEQFKSTAWFTDSVVNTYLQDAKKQAWYKNTLFILMADHGHRLPRGTTMAYDPAKYHIPLLFYGDVIKPKYRGTKISKLGNQVDLAATLLAQLNLPHQQFTWSKNLLNPYSREFSFFDWDNGFGYITLQQAVSYDNSGKRVIYRRNKNADEKVTEQVLFTGKAFMQQIFTEYLAY